MKTNKHVNWNNHHASDKNHYKSVNFIDKQVRGKTKTEKS